MRIFISAKVRAFALLTLVTGGLPIHAEARAPFQHAQAPGYYRVMIGTFEVTALNDGTALMPMDELLSAPPDVTRQALSDAFLDSPTEVSVNAYLVNTGERLVLVDAGAGQAMGEGLGKLTSNLGQAGYSVDQIDDILLTHLHEDHIGGLVRESAIVFPNAYLHISRAECSFWLSETDDESAGNQGMFIETVRATLQPYAEADKIDCFETGAEVVPSITAMNGAGHTPGHTAYLVADQGQQLLLVGDGVHLGAVQFENPSVSFAFDHDPAQASVSRGVILANAARDGMMVGAAHLSFPGLGHLREASGHFEWIPISYTILH